MTAPTIYRSDDTGAPELVGTTNSSFINLLKDCLVNGYGTKPAAGWTVAFDDTTNHKAVFRQGGGNQRYLRVVDDGSDYASNQAYARIVGYGSMTDIDNGSDPFPSETQVPGGLYAHKSYYDDSNPRPWLIAATDKFFLLYADLRNEDPLGTDGWGGFVVFGDFQTHRSGDEWNTLIFGTPSGAVADAVHFSEFNETGGLFLARDSSNAGSVKFYLEDDSVYDCSEFGTNTYPYPDPVTGKLLLSRVAIMESGSNLARGILPGIWNTPHNYSNFNSFDIFQGSDNLSGKEYQFIRVDDTRMMVLETNGGWL